jgi:hypothetical protein
VVLHLKKASGNDAGTSAHIERTIHPKNADEKRTHLNRELIRDINPSHKIFVYFPPLRHSISLSNSCDAQKKLSDYKARFNQSMLPNEITLPNGSIIRRPANWN